MSNIHDNSPCPICGKTWYSRGEVTAQSLRYVAENASFYERHFGSKYKIPARQCNNCGNIQLFSQDFVGKK